MRTLHDIEVRRPTLATVLAVVFVVDLVVMGSGALYSYQQTPPVPGAIEGPTEGRYSPTRTSRRARRRPSPTD